MPGPLITLTTDFGESDYFVGAMKGVILSICPSARIVDLSHEVEPYSILSAAFLLSQSVPHFPEGTIHAAVVDPGVGTSRRPLLAHCAGQFLIGPDNGIFSLLYGGSGEIRALTNHRYFRSPLSNTFHGRDIFAPVAAHLAGGVPMAEFGEEIHDPVRIPHFRPVESRPGFWEGQVIHGDRFGNLVTNFHGDQFREVLQGRFCLRLGAHETRLLKRTFGEEQPGVLFALFGSAGYLEIVMNGGSARQHTGAVSGTPVTLEPTPNA